MSEEGRKIAETKIFAYYKETSKIPEAAVNTAYAEMKEVSLSISIASIEAGKAVCIGSITINNNYE